MIDLMILSDHGTTKGFGTHVLKPTHSAFLASSLSTVLYMYLVFGHVHTSHIEFYSNYGPLSVSFFFVHV